MQNTISGTSLRQQPSPEPLPLGPNFDPGSTPQFISLNNEEFKGERITRNTRVTEKSEYCPTHPYSGKFEEARISQNNESLEVSDRVFDNVLTCGEVGNINELNQVNISETRICVPNPQIEPPLSPAETSSQIQPLSMTRNLEQGVHVAAPDQIRKGEQGVVEEIARDHFESVQFMELIPGHSIFLTVFTMVGIGGLMAL